MSKKHTNYVLSPFNCFIFIIIIQISLISLISSTNPSYRTDAFLFEYTLVEVSAKLLPYLSNIVSNSTNITDECKNTIKNTFLSENNQSYVMKLFYDSSPTYDDMKNYYYCYNDINPYVQKNILPNLTYIIIIYKELSENKDINSFEYKFNSFSKVFGACVPQGCTDNDYEFIIKGLNEKYNLKEGEIGKVVNLKPNSNYSNKEIIFGSAILFLMTLFIIFLIFIKFFGAFFVKIFGLFFKIFHLKYKTENIDKVLKKNRRIQIERILNFLKFTTNIEEIMPSSKLSEINNEDGLQIVIGLRSIFIIGLFLGMTLRSLFTTPTRSINYIQFQNFMESNLYTILFFLERNSLKMLYALSGFELTYKLICYLDKQLYQKYIVKGETLDLSSVNKFSQKRSKTLPVKGNNFYNPNNNNKFINERDHFLMEKDNDKDDDKLIKASTFVVKKDSSNSLEKRKIYLINHDNLDFKFLFKFHFKQFYLYFIFVFTILYFKFCLAKFFGEMLEKGNLWMLVIPDVKVDFDTKILLSTLFLFADTCDLFKDYYNFFVPIMNEIFFYLFGSTLIYFCYKKNSRLDIYLIYISLIVIILKISAYFGVNLYVKNYKKEQELYFPSFYFMQRYYVYLLRMHLMNLSYYCIGMFFGLANYSIQNDLTRKNIVKEFVKFPRLLLKKVKRKFIFLIIIFFTLIFVLLDCFSYNIVTDKDNYFNSIVINILNLIDSEIIIILIFIIVMTIFYSDFGILRYFFNIYTFKILSRMYFLIIYLGQMQSTYFLLDYATKIHLNIYGIIYVFLLITFLTIAKTVAVYLIFQVPLKKITKFISSESKKMILELEKIEKSNNEENKEIEGEDLIKYMKTNKINEIGKLIEDSDEDSEESKENEDEEVEEQEEQEDQEDQEDNLLNST